MARILLVDDAAALIGLFGAAITARLGHQVTVITSLAEVEELWLIGGPKELLAEPFDLAIVDLAFPQERDTGLSALYGIHAHSPSTRLGIITQGDVWTEAVLRDAWELLPVEVMLSKGSALDYQIDQIRRVLGEGRIEIDPALRLLLPAERNPWRTPQSFQRLVCHQGHAKLWRSLIESGDQPSYAEIAMRCGLSVNTVKNYRTQLLTELEFHGLRAAGLGEMSEFAKRCRAFLLPYLSD